MLIWHSDRRMGPTLEDTGALTEKRTTAGEGVTTEFVHLPMCPHINRHSVAMVNPILWSLHATALGKEDADRSLGLLQDP